MPTTSAFERAHGRAFADVGLDPDSRTIDLSRPPVRVHLAISGGTRGEDVPVVCLHSGGTFGATFAPLMAELADRRTIAVDRPGFGLSGDFTYDTATYRTTIVDVVSGILDALGVERVDLVGNSSGGYWSVVYAMANPDRVRRVTLLGSLPALPDTSPPLPLRTYAVPGLNRLLSGLFLAADEADVIEKFDIFGEGETIKQYPGIVDAVVARDTNPRAAGVDISDMSALLSVRGWRAGNRLTESELTSLAVPTLAVWGEDDPICGPAAVRDLFDAMPDARLEAIDAGHVPWFGHARRCAELIESVAQASTRE